jgi:hypothetical protein
MNITLFTYVGIFIPHLLALQAALSIVDMDIIHGATNIARRAGYA